MRGSRIDVDKSISYSHRMKDFIDFHQELGHVVRLDIGSVAKLVLGYAIGRFIPGSP